MKVRRRLHGVAVIAGTLVTLAVLMTATRAEDPPDRVGQLVAQLAGEADPGRLREAVAELVLLGDAARPPVERTLDDGAVHRDRLEAALDALDCAARLRAESEGFAFWTAFDEARTRTIAFDAVLRSAVPDAAARKRVVDADQAAAGVVEAFLTARPAVADAAPWHQRLAAAGPSALVRLLDAAVGPEPEIRVTAIGALVALKVTDAVPHLVFDALPEDDPSAPEALRALESVAGLPLPAPAGSEAEPGTDSERLVAWWVARKPRNRAAERHLAHRVLLALAAAGMRAEAASERIERLNRVLGHGEDVMDVTCEDAEEGPPRLSDDSLESLRSAWRSSLTPASWRTAAATLRAATCYHGSAIGEGADVSSTRRAYAVLAETAPIDEIVTLTAAPEPVLRLYAFRALTVREGVTSRVLDLFERIARAGGTVEAQFGCCIGRETPGDVLLQDLGVTSDQDRRRFLECALDRGVRLAQVTWMLSEIPLDRFRRPQLRRLADEGVDGALMAIARWRDAEDASYFASKVDAAGDAALDAHELLDAVAAHGATGTGPRLAQLAPAVRRRCADDADWTPSRYLAALAASRDAVSERGLSSLLGDDLSNAPATLLRFVSSEVGSAPGAAFSALRWRLWEASAWSRAAAVESMATLDRDRAVRLALRDLGQPRPEFGIDPNSADLIPARLAVVRAQDPVAASAAAAGLLRDLDYTVARAVAPLLSSWHDEALVEPLFDALTSATNAHAFLPVARALLAYDRPEIDERLRKAAASTDHLHANWGGEHLAKLLSDPPRTWEAGEPK